MSNLVLRKRFEKVVSSESSGKSELQQILNEQPINLTKLAHFASRNVLPPSYRALVWKLLMGIIPRYTESQAFVFQQYSLIYDDLFAALKVLKLRGPSISVGQDIPGSTNSPLGPRASLVLYKNGWNGHLNDTKNPEPEHFLLMWLISEARLLRNSHAQLRTKQNRWYLAIAHRISSIFEDPVDMYHILSSLWALLRDNHLSTKKAVQYGIGLLRKQNDALHRHLLTVGLFSHTLLEDLCQSMFCEIIPDTCVEKIIDKIFTKKFGILSCMIACMLNKVQDPLFASTTVENIRNVISCLRPEQAELITRCALDQWHKEEFVL